MRNPGDLAAWQLPAEIRSMLRAAGATAATNALDHEADIAKVQ
jgi:hypothetical protein